MLKIKGMLESSKPKERFNEDTKEEAESIRQNSVAKSLTRNTLQATRTSDKADGQAS